MEKENGQFDPEKFRLTPQVIKQINRKKQIEKESSSAWAIETLETLSNLLSDGHYTIMRFTTNVRVCLGPQPGCRDEIAEMTEGVNLPYAVANLLQGLKEHIYPTTYRPQPNQKGEQ